MSLLFDRSSCISERVCVYMSVLDFVPVNLRLQSKQKEEVLGAANGLFAGQ